MIPDNKEYILLIINCEKYRYKADFQKESWLKTLPPYITYYHVLGDPNLEKEYYFDNINHLLTVQTMDDYISLPKKVVSSYKAIYETFPYFKYIFKTDDDQNLTNPKFFDILTGLISNKKPKTHYGGFLVDITTPYLSKYCLIHPELPDNMVLQRTKYCSGRFYFLSQPAIVNLISKRIQIGNEYLEDYAIGLHLGYYYKENILNIDTNKYFKDMDS
jgi:hypothetical protein